MKVILVTDIFGHTTHLNEWVRRLSALGAKCHIISPYEYPSPEFEHDQLAYEYYTAQGGHDVYRQRLLDQTQLLQRADLIIGFSAGASALWHFCSQTFANALPKTVLFYPSHIRNQLTLTPKLPTEIIFASHEPHFSVDEVMASLAHQQNDKLTLTKSAYLHGVINPASQNYNLQAAELFFNFIAQKIIQRD